MRRRGAGNEAPAGAAGTGAELRVEDPDDIRFGTLCGDTALHHVAQRDHVIRTLLGLSDDGRADRREGALLMLSHGLAGKNEVALQLLSSARQGSRLCAVIWGKRVWNLSS